jgi:hypothetical protein
VGVFSITTMIWVTAAVGVGALTPGKPQASAASNRMDKTMTSLWFIGESPPPNDTTSYPTGAGFLRIKA